MDEKFKAAIYFLNAYILEAISIVEVRRVQKEIAEALKEKLRRQWDDGDEIGMTRTMREIERMLLENKL